MFELMFRCNWRFHFLPQGLNSENYNSRELIDLKPHLFRSVIQKSDEETTPEQAINFDSTRD